MAVLAVKRGKTVTETKPQLRISHKIIENHHPDRYTHMPLDHLIVQLCFGLTCPWAHPCLHPPCYPPTHATAHPEIDQASGSPGFF